MKQSKLFTSIVFVVLMLGLTSCYTQLGYVTKEQAYEEYQDNPELYEEAIEEYEANHVIVQRHIYVPSVYHPTYVYFDPYDAWYYEPGFHFTIGYYTGPAYIYSGAYFCYPPVHYPHYYPPYHYPYPVYGHPVWVGGGHYGPRYGYNPPVMKRRGFARRGDRVLAGSSEPLKRRGSGNSGQLTRRTNTNAPSSGNTDDGRRRIDKRRTTYFGPDNTYYTRNRSEKRTKSTYTKKSTNEERRNTNSRNRKTYTSNGSKKSNSSYKKPTSKRSGESSKKRVSRSSTKKSTPTVSPSRSSGNTRSRSTRSSGTSVRSSGGSSKSSSGGGSRSSSGGSSRSSSSSSGKSRRR